jgi:hypothetical protein
MAMRGLLAVVAGALANAASGQGFHDLEELERLATEWKLPDVAVEFRIVDHGSWSKGYVTYPITDRSSISVRMRPPSLRINNRLWFPFYAVNARVLCARHLGRTGNPWTAIALLQAIDDDRDGVSEWRSALATTALEFHLERIVDQNVPMSEIYAAIKPIVDSGLLREEYDEIPMEATKAALANDILAHPIWRSQGRWNGASTT